MSYLDFLGAALRHFRWIPHLADDESRGPHPQRLAHETAQRDLTGALEARIASLHRDPIRVLWVFPAQTTLKLGG